MELDSLENLLEMSLANPNNERLFYVVCSVTDSEIEFAARKAGLDIAGFLHIVENYALLHTLRKHGNPMTEATRGQLAVAPETFHFIPLIVNDFDKIGYEFVKNRHSLLYEKNIGDRT